MSSTRYTPETAQAMVDAESACWGCGAPPHEGDCIPRCTECGAIATGLTPDETDMSVGLFGPGPMCVACDKKMQREYDADPTQPGALLINLRNALRYGKR